MFTPQEIDQVSFSRATFGGYDMQAVDEFLEPLTEDYITLYKENALLKSKMKVLVTKLEEYRNNESSMKDAIVNAQKTCDHMVKDAEAKCTQMLTDANAAATENAKNADLLIAAEKSRVEEAKKTACSKIDEMQTQLKACMQALDRIKQANIPAPQPAAPAAAAAPAYDYERADASADQKDTDAVADEISASLQALMGSTDDAAPTAEPRHPSSETTTGKFANLQFGRNYDPKSKRK